MKIKDIKSNILKKKKYGFNVRVVYQMDSEFTKAPTSPALKTHRFV